MEIASVSIVTKITFTWGLLEILPKVPARRSGQLWNADAFDDFGRCTRGLVEPGREPQCLGKVTETDKEDGKPIKCRFLDDQGSCQIQDGKPGVCWLYPFASWMESYNSRPLVHATFQFTGDCPGFYLSKTIDDALPVLNDYSFKIYNYNMSTNRTIREGFGATNIIS